MENNKRPVLICIATSCLLGIGAFLFLFNPAEYSFYPRCLLHSITGLSCVGCGCLRATHQLLHGNLKAAFLLNPLFIVLLPFLAVLGAREAFRAITGRELFKFSIPNHFIWPLVAVIFLFTVLRNLPDSTLNF